MTVGDDLDVWLRVVLDDLEHRARAALRDDGDHGVWVAGSGIGDCTVEGDGITIYDEGGHTAEQARHIATWDPYTALNVVCAIRAVLDLNDIDGPDGGFPDGFYEAKQGALRRLAAAFAHLPGYREEWRP